MGYTSAVWIFSTLHGAGLPSVESGLKWRPARLLKKLAEYFTTSSHIDDRSCNVIDTGK
jgi:hypothetical protein